MRRQGILVSSLATFTSTGGQAGADAAGRVYG